MEIDSEARYRILRNDLCGNHWGRRTAKPEDWVRVGHCNPDVKSGNIHSFGIMSEYASFSLDGASMPSLLR
jgi:hypothetical protein